jgi:hypothetical protein
MFFEPVSVLLYSSSNVPITILSSGSLSFSQTGIGDHRYLFLARFQSGAEAKTSENLFLIVSGTNQIFSAFGTVVFVSSGSLINQLVNAFEISGVSHLRQ